MYDISSNANVRSCIIVDSPKVMGMLVEFMVLLIIGAFLMGAWIDGCSMGFAVISCIPLLFSFLFFCCFWVNRKGYVLDIERNMFEFPGGGIEAENWSCYFKPEYWFQGFKRHQKKLSEIRQVEAYKSTRTAVYANVRGGLFTRSYNENILQIDGDFGAVTFNFRSKGKRDQLYSALIQINKMGSPILKR